jgi:hypothetical protein
MNNKNPIETRDFLTLLDLALLRTFLFVVLALVKISRRIWKTLGVRNRLKARLGPEDTESLKFEEETSQASSVSDGDSASDNSILESMIVGRINCRPDLKAEFLRK